MIFTKEECDAVGYFLLPTLEGIEVRGAFGDYYNANYITKGKAYGVTWIVEARLINEMLFNRELKEILE